MNESRDSLFQIQTWKRRERQRDSEYIKFRIKFPREGNREERVNLRTPVEFPRPSDATREHRFASKIIVSTSRPYPLLKRHGPPRENENLNGFGMESRISTIQ